MTLFLVLLFVSFLLYKSIKRYGKIFNPFTLSIQIPLLFLIIPQIFVIAFLNGENSILSDSVIALFVWAIYIGTYIKLPRIKICSFRYRKLLLWFTYILVIILFIPLIPLLMNFGLSISGLRHFYEFIVFSQYASFYAIIKKLILFIIVILFVENRRLTLHSLILIFILFFSGSKMAILSTAVVIATLWEEYRKMNYKYLLMIFGCLFGGLVLYHFFQSSYVTEDTTPFDTALSYFDVYRQQSLALDMFSNGEIDFFYGEISLSSWYKVIPRFLWADKPKDFGFALLNYKIYPEYAVNGYMPSLGLAYTFADFGFISIIVSGFLAGAVKNYWYNIFYKSSKSVVGFLLYALEVDIVLILMFVSYYLISNIKLSNDT